MATLYIVATPIGNLEDITLRALRILKEVDLILCEDTRVTRILLQKYDIHTKVESYDAHSSKQKHLAIIKLLENEKNIALVTDAGTPCISDPGFFLINELYKLKDETIKVVPIPGPSALTAALSAGGVSAMPFSFLGFIPQKKGRETFFKSLPEYDHTVVVYESPHRIEKTLESLSKVLKPTQVVVIARELTKMFEELVRGNITEIALYFEKNPDHIRGEFTLIIGPEDSYKA